MRSPKLMNKYFDVMGSVISLYEGSIEKFSGDGVMAVFGVPDFTEKTAMNAVRAAVEFLFKHALAQQATYDSIMVKTRKSIHLKIAGSIEKVFTKRIHEFYGTLAHHSGKAGQNEKTEEYLIKAGEESMKSGDSSGAVHFLKKAIEAHLQNNRNIPDRQKVVDLEEKLGFALHASGQYTEAVEYFEKVICFYHKSFPITDFQRKLSLPYSLFVMIKIIYFTRPDRDRTGHWFLLIQKECFLI